MKNAVIFSVLGMSMWVGFLGCAGLALAQDPAYEELKQKVVERPDRLQYEPGELGFSRSFFTRGGRWAGVLIPLEEFSDVQGIKRNRRKVEFPFTAARYLRIDAYDPDRAGAKCELGVEDLVLSWDRKPVATELVSHPAMPQTAGILVYKIGGENKVSGMQITLDSQQLPRRCILSAMFYDSKTQPDPEESNPRDDIQQHLKFLPVHTFEANEYRVKPFNKGTEVTFRAWQFNSLHRKGSRRFLFSPVPADTITLDSDMERSCPMFVWEMTVLDTKGNRIPLSRAKSGRLNRDDIWLTSGQFPLPAATEVMGIEMSFQQAEPEHQMGCTFRLSVSKEGAGKVIAGGAEPGGEAGPGPEAIFTECHCELGVEDTAREKSCFLVGRPPDGPLGIEPSQLLAEIEGLAERSDCPTKDTKACKKLFENQINPNLNKAKLCKNWR